MIGHQAKGMNPVAESFHPLLQEQIKSVSVFIFEENVFLRIATKDDVANSGEFRNSTVTLPKKISGGYYYPGAIADRTGLVSEGIETNNTLSGNYLRVN